MSEIIYLSTVIYFVYVIYTVYRNEIDEYVKLNYPRYASILNR